VEITGTIQLPDGSTDHITTQGGTYEEAKPSRLWVAPTFGGSEDQEGPIFALAWS
jgi:hypothetical protein